MASVEDEAAVKNRKPKGSKFKQQALPAWQPILTAGTVLPAFFVIGVAFVPIGVGLIYFSNGVKEVSYDYTDCTNNDKQPCYKVIEDNPMAECSCTIDLQAEDFGTEDWEGNTYIYYGLTDFYQNHRRYVKSRDDRQLLGDLATPVDNECAPFDKPDNESNKYYAPCGAIANSLFSDVIVLQYKNKDESDAQYRDVQVSRRKISWESDRGNKFKNPEVPAGETLQSVFEKANFVKPRDWRKPLWELDTQDPDNNGLLNEDLIVWMRAAALPNFRKLYRRVDHENEANNNNFNSAFADGLPVKNFDYRLNIDYSFRVKQFKGTKSVIISTTSLLGGKNPFLGIAYIVVGCICLIIGVIFLFIHLRCARPIQDVLNINSRTPYT